MKRTFKNGKSKKGGPSSEVPNDIPHGGRASNWSEDETNILIDAACEVKLKNGRKDMNFKENEYNEIHSIFCSRLNNSSRSAATIYHRLKHLKGQYNTAKNYASKSGWSWNFDLNMLTAPSSEILEDIIAGDPAKLNFLRKPFPWYSQLMKLSGGSRARGDVLVRKGARPNAKNRANTENSGTGSSSDSSANPGDEGPVEGHIDIEVDQQPYPNADEENGPNFMGRQCSDGSNPISRSSGSYKRKSTDEAEPSSRGKKIQKTLNERTEFFKKAADNGANTIAIHREMVAIFQSQLSIAQKRLEKMDAEEREKENCVQRMVALGIQGPIRVKIMQKFTDPGARVVWMHGNNEDVYQWITDTFPTQQHPQPFEQNPMSNMNQPAPNPTMNMNATDMLMNFLNNFQRPPSQ